MSKHSPKDKLHSELLMLTRISRNTLEQQRKWAKRLADLIVLQAQLALHQMTRSQFSPTELGTLVHTATELARPPKEQPRQSEGSCYCSKHHDIDGQVIVDYSLDCPVPNHRRRASRDQALSGKEGTSNPAHSRPAPAIPPVQAPADPESFGADDDDHHERQGFVQEELGLTEEDRQRIHRKNS